MPMMHGAAVIVRGDDAWKPRSSETSSNPRCGDLGRGVARRAAAAERAPEERVN
jgi:hypothetical protein